VEGGGLRADCLSPAHRWGHYLYELRDDAGLLVAKIACAPELLQVFGVQLGEQTSLTKQPVAEMREPLANTGA
jgi:hypothetical protein